MTQSIPASFFVTVNPNVLAAGGTGLALSGMFLTTNVRVPIGTVMTFPDAASVGAFFGLGSAEYNHALMYFGGYVGGNITPAAMLFYQYTTGNVGAYLNGGNIGALGLAALNALPTGTITVTIDGTPHTSGTIDLTTAVSFSAAAATIQTALAAGTVTYDSTTGGFIVHSGTTGTSSTITFASGGISANLLLTQATGAYLSQGAAAATPSAAMGAISTITQNWATFTTIFNPDNSGNANKLLFSAWNSAQKSRYMYVAWDTDATPTNTNPATNSLGYLVNQAGYGGTMCLYEPTEVYMAAFVMGMVASIDFTQTQGKVDLAYKTAQNGIVPPVTSSVVLTDLIANFYNSYCAAATAAQGFNFFYPGSVSGAFKWADAYVNQIWMNSEFQLDLMLLLTQIKSVPYNAAGRGLIEQALMGTINQALDFGAIQAGVALSPLQVAEVNAAAGVNISDTLQQRGWYLQVKPATATVRANRGSPPRNFWYTDGGSVHTINLASIDVQ